MSSLAYRVDDHWFSTASTLQQVWLSGYQLARGIGAMRYTAGPQVDEFYEYDQYNHPDWDGYGAEPIARETVRAARAFLRLLPLDVTQPDIAPGGDGTIGLEWRSGSPSNRSFILIDIGPGDLVVARRIDEAGRIERLQPTHVETGARALVAQLLS